MASTREPARTRRPYAVAARQLLRDTLFDAARDALQQRAWADITMADIASAAGVSRQTLYKEFGTRDEFSAAFVIREGERFLDAVERAVREHLDDPRAAVAAALEVFLVTAGEDPLMRILLSDDGTGGMLPLVTTQSMPVVTWASARLAAVMRDGWPKASEHDAQLLGETLVRLAISYVTVPKGTPEATAADAAALLGPYIERALNGRA
ncbi:MAG TPA: TetR family transcriptional regulator [Conexibacter sp.]|nr:TetR family transcriptional regulator [Conexibacter sp.]